MSRKSHAPHRSVTPTLVVSLVLLFSFRSPGVFGQEPTPRIVLLPLQATNSGPGVASYHLVNGLLWELSKVTDVTVTHPNDVISSIRKAHDFPSWLRDQDESLVLIGSVSGPEDRLTINIIVFDTRARSKDRVLEKTLTSDVYNLDYAYKALASTVIAMVDRHPLPNGFPSQPLVQTGNLLQPVQPVEP